MSMSRPDTMRRQGGVVLMVVLFFSLLLTASIASFQRQTVIDAMISRNRDEAARAEALARGGVRIAQALLIQDRLEEAAGADPVDSNQDLWATFGSNPITVGDGTITIQIEDVGSRLNINALFGLNAEGQLAAKDAAEPFLIEMLKKVIDELPVDPGIKALYEPRDLAENLIDWIDADEFRGQGGSEDSYYESQDPPYRAANMPMLSPEELRRIEGFDDTLVRGLLPFLTVYPFAPGGCESQTRGCGINVNTAPKHVLALIYYNDGVDDRLANEEDVRRILEARQEGSICAPASSQGECTPMNEIVPNPIFPPPTFSSQIFLVVAEAQVGNIRRSVEAVVDRSETSHPRLLSWRVR
jgi:type II secretory pathway component PulK